MSLIYDHFLLVSVLGRSATGTAPRWVTPASRAHSRSLAGRPGCQVLLGVMLGSQAVKENIARKPAYLRVRHNVLKGVSLKGTSLPYLYRGFKSVRSLGRPLIRCCAKGYGENVLSSAELSGITVLWKLSLDEDEPVQ
ncbi:jg21974 [Pararge aegeria aegeria]|uniref:Jg21974 protein n=1 Tax=Pararge aegeria aegeria TaxID=348720 RepID=A0A8S4S271_9NEOP|nr:jg21974 [Pararge aegeria aegeria]